MNETFKKTVACITIGSFGSAALVALNDECGRGQMCSITPPEMWHVEQDTTPGPMFGVVFSLGTVSSVDVHSSILLPLK